MIVSDANVIVYLIAREGDEHSRQVERVWSEDPVWFAPSLWRSEVLNVLSKKSRIRGLELASARRAFEMSERLVKTAPFIPDIHVLELALQMDISSYDAEYAALAISLECPLVTADRRLRKAFPAFAMLPHEFIT